MNSQGVVSQAVPYFFVILFSFVIACLLGLVKISSIVGKYYCKGCGIESLHSSWRIGGFDVFLTLVPEKENRLSKFLTRTNGICLKHDWKPIFTVEKKYSIWPSSKTHTDYFHPYSIFLSDVSGLEIIQSSDPKFLNDFLTNLASINFNQRPINWPFFQQAELSKINYALSELCSMKEDDRVDLFRLWWEQLRDNPNAETDFRLFYKTVGRK